MHPPQVLMAFQHIPIWTENRAHRSTAYSVSNYPLGLRKILRTESFVNSRLGDRIRELCALATVVWHDDQRELILVELKAALHEHAERLKKTAVQKLVTQEKD